MNKTVGINTQQDRISFIREELKKQVINTRIIGEPHILNLHSGNIRVRLVFKQGSNMPSLERCLANIAVRQEM